MPTAFRQPKLDAAGKPVPYHISYPDKDDNGNFLSHPTAGFVVGVHNLGWAFIQATVAILILVGIRIGDCDGRRGAERQTRHSHSGDRFTFGAGGVLLFDSSILPPIIS